MEQQAGRKVPEVIMDGETIEHHFSSDPVGISERQHWKSYDRQMLQRELGECVRVACAPHRSSSKFGAPDVKHHQLSSCLTDTRFFVNLHFARVPLIMSAKVEKTIARQQEKYAP